MESEILAATNCAIKYMKISLARKYAERFTEMRVCAVTHEKALRYTKKILGAFKNTCTVE